MTTQVKPQRGLEGMAPYVPGTPIEEVKRESGLEDVKREPTGAISQSSGRY